MIARRHRVHAIVADRYRAEIESYLTEHSELQETLSFAYVPHHWSRILDRLWPPYYLWSYRRWLEHAYDAAQSLHQENAFDLVHLITYVGYRTPGRFCEMDIPFVWGPIGGLENTPWRLFRFMDLYGRIYYAGRNLLNAWDIRMRAAPRRAFAKAARTSSIIAATSGIHNAIQQHYGVDSTVICEIGPPPESASQYTLREHGQPMRLSWNGALLSGKALPMLLHALQQLPPDLDWRLDIVGDGPCRKRWQRHARTLGIHNRIIWHGRMSRDEAVRLVHESHLFIITSIKDLTSSVLLEAISQGVPVICPDHCGFPDVVTDDCGIRIPVTTPRQIVSDLADAIQALADDEPRRRRLAQGALRRIGEFTWEKKAEKLEAIYEDAVAAKRG